MLPWNRMLVGGDSEMKVSINQSVNRHAPHNIFSLGNIVYLFSRYYSIYCALIISLLCQRREKPNSSPETAARRGLSGFLTGRSGERTQEKGRAGEEEKKGGGGAAAEAGRREEKTGKKQMLHCKWNTVHDSRFQNENMWPNLYCMWFVFPLGNWHNCHWETTVFVNENEGIVIIYPRSHRSKNYPQFFI